MKVLFLDIDGPLRPYVKGLDPDYIDINKTKMVAKVIEETGAKVVLSTSWKDEAGIEEKLYSHGLPQGCIIGKTQTVDQEKYKSLARSEEILLYINAHEDEIEEYVVIDDITRFYPKIGRHLILCERLKGFTAAHVPLAIDVLRGKLMIYKRPKKKKKS